MRFCVWGRDGARALGGLAIKSDILGDDLRGRFKCIYASQIVIRKLVIPQLLVPYTWNNALFVGACESLFILVYLVFTCVEWLP